MSSLAQAVEWAESRGNPRALSPKGAMGLMQLMPGTARDPGFGVQGTDDPWNPDENRRVGRAYLDAMLKRYDGDQKAALAAYNWGPGNVDKWIAGGRDPSRLPDETRNYIASVTAHAGQEIPTPGQSQPQTSGDQRMPQFKPPIMAPGMMPTPMQSGLASGNVAAMIPQQQPGGPLSAAMAQPQPPQAQPMGNPPTGGEQDGNYFTRLFSDPGFMQGLTVLGEGLSGASLGTALGRSQAIRGSMTKQREEEERRRKWAQMFSGQGETPPVLRGLPAETVEAIRMMGPEDGRKVLGQLLLQQSKPQGPLSVKQGETLLDPKTYQPIYQGQSAAELEGAKVKAREEAKVQVAQPQARKAVTDAEQNMDRLAREATELLEDPNLDWAVGPLQGKYIPTVSKGVSNFDAKLDTLKSQIAFSVLQAMRDASKTGGALGQVSERELDLLQNNLATLDQAQGEGQFRESLRKIMQYAQGAKQRIRQGYAATYGQAETGSRQRYRYNPETGELE